MQIVSLGHATTPTNVQRVPERVEGPGPDRDNDGDEKTSVKSSLAANLGKVVDTTA